MIRIAFGIGLALWSLLPVHAACQEAALAFGATAGIAIPSGRLAELRQAGPSVALSAALGRSRSWMRFRLDAESLWFYDRSGGSADLRVRSVMGYLQVRPRAGALRPYLLLGLGSQELRVPAESNPYGWVWGAALGGGLELRLARLEAALEVRSHLTVTDYGLREDFATHAYTPLTLGIRF